MEIAFPLEIEKKLAHIASARGRESAALVLEAVEQLISYDAWFVAEVERGLAQVKSGQTLSHEDVGARLQKHLSAKLSPA